MGRLSEHDAEIYFADREAHGFNTAGWIDVTCAGHDYPNNVVGTTPDGIRPFLGFLSGGTDYQHYDFTKPNEAYFSRLDHIVQIAANHHQAVFLDPMETIGWLQARCAITAQRRRMLTGSISADATNVSQTSFGSMAMTLIPGGIPPMMRRSSCGEGHSIC